MIKRQIVFFLGGPGSGKGTQSALLTKNMGFVYLCAGDELRKERNTPGSEFGDIIESKIKNGEIVPSEITVSLLRKAMMKAEKDKLFLIDGFPRNKQNLEGWNKEMKPEEEEVANVIYLSCGKYDTLIDRILKRAETSGRIDDNRESLEKRLKTYEESTLPIIQHFKKQQDTVIEVPCQLSVEEVYARIEKALSPLLERVKK